MVPGDGSLTEKPPTTKPQKPSTQSKQPTPQPQTRYETELLQYRSFIEDLTADQRQIVKDLIIDNPNRPASLLYKMKKRLAATESEIAAKTEPQIEPEPKPAKSPIPQKIKKPRLPRGSKVRTLRGAIKAMGGINFLHFKGELKEMPTAVKFLSRKSGVPIDFAEQSLKNDGWLDENESLLEILRDPEVLKRGKVSRADEWTETKRPEELTERQKQIKQEMQWEPEEPPAGNYKRLKAQDLPDGTELTIIEGESTTGWDVYKVVRKGKKVILEDGTDIELNENDFVDVLESDLPEGFKAPEIVETIPGTEAEKELEEFFEKAAKGEVAEPSKSDYIRPQGTIYEASEKQLKFDFKERSPKERAEDLEISDLSGDAQRVRMASTGRIKGPSPYIHSAQEAASLLAHIRKSPQELFYVVTVDDTGKILEIHKYSKGLKGSARVLPSEAAGHVLNIEGADKAYFVHNHPGGDPTPSDDDIHILQQINKILELKNIPSENLIISDNKWVKFSGNQFSDPQNIVPVLRKVELPEKERIYAKRAKYQRDKAITDPRSAEDYLRINYPGKEGFLFLDNKGTPLSFTDYPKGKSLRTITRDYIAKAERLNARSVIVALNEMTPEREAFIDNLKSILPGDVNIIDIVLGGKSLGASKSYSRLPSKHSVLALEVLNSEKILHVHPSTITGPIGGIAAGVDWEEYEKTGKIKVDPERMFKGALIGAGAGAAISIGKRSVKIGQSVWDRKVIDPFIRWLKRKANGLVVGEFLRHQLGLSRSEELKNP
ncbi:MAG: hypothetical protein JRH18_19980 [Deltaproteobacteria bacterium]|nr:hypothetical protein [Deltaproteobacteria bacterium]MBW2153931.1 hypothetical protein [Deltaproteobacteria bacterium]